MRYQVGDKASMSKTVSESDVYSFAGITGDLNPAHVNEVWAKKSRVGGRIAHGMLTGGFISAVLGMQLPGPGTIYLQQSLKFTAPVRLGDTITAEVEVL
ncbi:MAG: MaoC family dehydratase, partial [Deltaproteobacteria bacterium]|nr:MaoC family dehydratase [Deltaproteobacteria bacterium]